MLVTWGQVARGGENDLQESIDLLEEEEGGAARGRRGQEGRGVDPKFYFKFLEGAWHWAFAESWRYTSVCLVSLGPGPVLGLGV